jgi:heptosyltransferase-2
MELPVIHFNCKYFIGDRPCLPNKQYGIFCENCFYFEKDPDITKHFPEIKSGDKTVYESSHKNILIIKLDAVGDVLRTTSILPSLKNIYPDSSIAWITKLKSYPVLEDNKFIDNIYFTDENIKDVISRNFDIAVNLDSGKESCEIMSKIPAEKKFGYTLANGKPYPLNTLANRWYLMGVDDNYKKQNTETYHKIIHEICGLEYNGSKPELEMTEKKRIAAGHINNKFGLHNYEEFILVNLGGGNRWQYKKWTKEGYADLINKLSYKKPYSAIGAVAGDEDREFYSEVMALVDKRDNVLPLGCDNTTEDFIGIVYLADKVFTSDSLAFHIATALNKYVVVIVGPTSSAELDAFGNGKILSSSKVECLVCYLNKCDKTVTCMNSINADEVVDYFL